MTQAKATAAVKHDKSMAWLAEILWEKGMQVNQAENNSNWFQVPMIPSGDKEEDAIMASELAVSHGCPLASLLSRRDYLDNRLCVLIG